MLDINSLQIKKINAEKNQKSLTFKIKSFSLLLEVHGKTKISVWWSYDYNSVKEQDLYGIVKHRGIVFWSYYLMVYLIHLIEWSKKHSMLHYI